MVQSFRICELYIPLYDYYNLNESLRLFIMYKERSYLKVILFSYSGSQHCAAKKHNGRVLAE